LRLTGRRLDNARIAMIGMGAANVATYRLLRAAGVKPAAIVGCDTAGTLHPGRTDVDRRQDEFSDKWLVCQESNGDRIVGDIAAARRAPIPAWHSAGRARI
jgi:malate dehydrogenase (oxaloacetate-decarboxylating)